MNQAKRDDLLGVLLAVIRWGAAGHGYCGDCGRITHRRSLFQPLVGTPPRNAPATTAAADAFLRAAMTMQRAGEPLIARTPRRCACSAWTVRCAAASTSCPALER